MKSSPPPLRNRAVIYARAASSRQAVSSTNDQVTTCNAECKRLGFDVVAAYKDEPHVCDIGVDRKGYGQMIAAAEAGDIDAIIVASLDRLSRDASELDQIRRQLGESGVTIHTLEVGVITSLHTSISQVWPQVDLASQVEPANQVEP